MSSFVLNIFEISLTMTAVILLMFILKKPVGAKFSAWSRYAVWTVLVLRLCIPVGAGIAKPLFNVTLPESVTAEHYVKNENVILSPESTQAAESTPSTGNEPSGEKAPPIGNVTPSTGNVTTSTGNAEQGTVHGSVTNVPDNLGIPATDEPDGTVIHDSEGEGGRIDTSKVLNALGILWLGGAVVFFAFRMGSYTLFAVGMRKKLHRADGRILQIYSALCDKLKVKHPPKLYVSGEPVSPMVYGYFRPRIAVPDLEFADEAHIRAVIAHELVHYRRHDLYVKLACTLAEALHWFNPAVHMAASRCISSMEIACDEAVILEVLDIERELYGESLVEIVRRCGNVRVSGMTTGMNDRRGSLKERIMNILDMSEKKRGAAIVALALCLCIIAGGVVGCSVDAGEDEGGSGKVNVNTESTDTDAEVTDTVESTDTVETTEDAAASSDGTESEPDEIQLPFTMPDQSYIGGWQDPGIASINIYEITSDSVKFNFIISYRVERIIATAVVKDGVLVFGDGISPGFYGPENLSGHLIIEDNKVSVIIDEFGKTYDAIKESGNVYECNSMYEMTDENLQSSLAIHPKGIYTYDHSTPTDDTPDEVQPPFTMPDQSYIGGWLAPGKAEMCIYEITSDYVKFHFTVIRTDCVIATAVEKDGVFVFGDGISPDFYGAENQRGHLVFEDNKVSVIFDDFGKAYPYFRSSGTVSGNVFECYPMIEVSDESIQYNIAHHPVGTRTYDRTGTDEKDVDDVTSNTYAGTYWQSTKSDEEAAEYAAKYPGNTPFLQLNEDGTCVFKVFFFHGSTYVNGVYTVEDNKITVELDTDSNPDIGGYIKLANGEYMYSEDGRKTPYMDSSFVFEIVDEDKLKICPGADSFYNGSCYVVKNGDVFAKKDYPPFTNSDAK